MRGWRLLLKKAPTIQSKLWIINTKHLKNSQKLRRLLTKNRENVCTNKIDSFSFIYKQPWFAVFTKSNLAKNSKIKHNQLTSASCSQMTGDGVSSGNSRLTLRDSPIYLDNAEVKLLIEFRSNSVPSDITSSSRFSRPEVKSIRQVIPQKKKTNIIEKIEEKFLKT